MTEKYIPVSCDLYDQLTEAAVLKKEINLAYTEGDGIHKIRTTVKNIFTKNKEEFLETSAGELIRLDKIVGVKG